MIKQTANTLTIELIRYFQQKDALVAIMDENPLENNTNNITLNFYNDKIKALRSTIKKEFPEKLIQIDSQRKDDCPAPESEHINK
jgi:hypothetical protein